MKIPLLALVIFIPCLFASVTECEIAKFEGLEASYVGKLYEEADVVIALGPKIEMLDNNTAKYRVSGVWKGEIGEYVYIKSTHSASVFFGKRIEPNILKASLHHFQLRRCPYIKDVLVSEFGKSKMPSATFFDRNHASSMLIWPAAFGLLAICGINIFLYRWVKT
ncbi:hypothetical protein A5320_16665 [Rheinheimera sp. SA_1]|uniref:hypothetical protein n=1 Tax=Rheinheimera sp. SA_1 TaxID=1827365 RepID=UPI000800A435|nr:hypothetical protein [Rheinheimera sp. SA_1]OBP13570.1 hypothetical protein A5320_16665 [Rheinheimera sp. SA_1]